MKKFKFITDIGAVVLSTEQMKKVIGGYGSGGEGSCTAKCHPSGVVSPAEVTCFCSPCQAYDYSGIVKGRCSCTMTSTTTWCP